MARHRLEEVRDALVAQMHRGEIRPGQQLPSERDLCVALGVSRTTLRAALDLLEADGLIDRVQGSGTFAREPRISFDTSVLVSFTQGVMDKGRVPGAELLSSGKVKASRAGGLVASALRLDDAAFVWQIVRLRTANEAPVALEHSWFPVALAPGLGDDDLERRSIYGLLHDRYGIELTSAEQRFEAVAAREDDADLLDCLPGDPLMRVTRTATTADGTAVEFARDLYLPQRSSFHTRAGIAAASPAPSPSQQEAPE